MERIDVIDDPNIRSLVMSEFDTVRTSQRGLYPEWGLASNRFGFDCGGLLFHNTTCFSSNGHWAIKVRTLGETIYQDQEEGFYDYGADDILPFYNPYHQLYNIPPEGFYRQFDIWNQHVIRLCVDDIVNVANSVVATIRARRGMYLTIGVDNDSAHILYSIDNECVLATTYLGDKFPGVELNLSYVTKISSIFSTYFNHIDMCISSTPGYPVMFKGKSRRDKMPDIRILLAQSIRKENEV